MSIVVQKFGGTSVADPTRIRRAARRAVEAQREGHQVVMVVSARGRKTDELTALAAEISTHPPPREMDMLLSTGEQESVALMAMAVHELGAPAISLTGAQIGVVTDSTHTRARIIQISTERMRAALNDGKIVIACGFQGIDEDFNITTLGRGGSDTTATALAAVLQADVCEIYTDVEGVFTIDPRLVENARKVSAVSYDEMLELASMGAGVMHSRSIEFAKKYRVPLCVRPSYSDGAGTLIVQGTDDAERVAAGIALMRDEARVTLASIPDRPGVMSLIFTKMAERKIPIDMVVQNVASDNRADVSFTVPQDDLAETLTAATEAVSELRVGSVEHGTNVAKVSAVGSGMKTHTGVAAKMFQSLSSAGVNIQMVTTSEIKVSVLVDRDRCVDAVRAVHAGFSLHEQQATKPPVGVPGQDSREGSPGTSVNRREEHAETGVPVSTSGGHDQIACGGSAGAADGLERDVVARLTRMEEIVVSDVRHDGAQSRVTISNVPDEPGIAAKLFAAVAEGGIVVDMIVQNVGHDKRAQVSFTIPRNDLERCLLLVREVLDAHSGADLGFDRNIAKLSVIGLRSHTGVGERMFRALAGEGINVQMINTSEIHISAVVSGEDGPAAHRCLLAEFLSGTGIVDG